MKNLFQKMILYFVAPSERDSDQANQMRFLKGENKILRAKLPIRIDLTAQDTSTCENGLTPIRDQHRSYPPSRASKFIRRFCSSKVAVSTAFSFSLTVIALPSLV